MRNFVYCPLCASVLGKKRIDGKDRSVCTTCGWINYLNPIPVVIAIPLSLKGDVAIVRRGVEPAKGAWALPGGFMEYGEEPAQACIRELKEETALDASDLRLVDVVHQKSTQYDSVVVIGFEAIIQNPCEAKAGDDVEAIRWVAWRDIPEMPFESYTRILQKWKNKLQSNADSSRID